TRPQRWIAVAVIAVLWSVTSEGLLVLLALAAAATAAFGSRGGRTGSHRAAAVCVPRERLVADDPDRGACHRALNGGGSPSMFAIRREIAWSLNAVHHRRALHQSEGSVVRGCLPRGLHLRGWGSAVHPPGRVHRLRRL